MSNTDEVMSALRDVIISQQDHSTKHEPTPNEYFACISVTLNTNVETSHVAELLKILSAMIPNASPSIVRMQFKALTTCLMRIGKACDEDSGNVLRLTISSLGLLANAQDHSDSTWNSVHALQCVNVFLSFLDNIKPRQRRIAQESLITLLTAHKKSNSKSLRSYVGDFCLQIIRSCSRSDYKRTLHVILFLEQSLCLLPDTNLLSILNASMNLQACQQPMLTAAVYRMYDALFQSPHFSFSGEQTDTFVKAVLSSRPDTVDMEANVYYCTALGSGVQCLFARDSVRSGALLVTAVQMCVPLCEGQFTQVHCAVSNTIKRIVTRCIGDSMVQEALGVTIAQPTGSKKQSLHTTSLQEMINVVEGLLQLRYQHAWVYVLDCVRALFDRFKAEQARVLLSSVVLKLADLYHAVETRSLQVDDAVHMALGDSLGAALRSCGVARFLSICPLRTPETPDYMGLHEGREWLLTIFHNNLKQMTCLLNDFGSCILSAAHGCNNAVKAPEQYGVDAMLVTVLRNRVIQLWSLFPGFCVNAGDVSTVFPRLAAVLEGVLKETIYPEIIPSVLLGLTSLATKARQRCPFVLNSAMPSSAEVMVLQSQASSIIPAVLRYLEAIALHDKNFQAGVHCIAAWASLAPAALLGKISKRLLQLLLTSTGNGMGAEAADEGAGWMSVVTSIIPYLSEPLVVLLYRTVSPLLSINESPSLQKRAYGVLDSLLKTHGPIVSAIEPLLSILGTVTDSLLTCHVSARNMRLRCLATIMSNMSAEDVASAARLIFGEVLICLKDANKKTRDAAIELLNTIIRQMAPEEVFVLLCSAVVGETASMRAAALTGLCMLCVERRDHAELLSQAGAVLPTVCLLLQEGIVEQSRAVLAYLRVCSAVLSPPSLLTVLPDVVRAFTTDLGQHKAKFACRCRGIMRKLCSRVGDEPLRQLVPEDDLHLLDYVQKQARKTQRRKDKQHKDKVAQMMGSDSEDCDADDQDEMDQQEEAEEEGHRNGHRNRHGGEDFRLTSRPQATRASDYQSAYPSSLEDLLEDQPASHSLGRAASSTSNAAPGSKRSQQRHNQSHSAAATNTTDEQGDVIDNEAFTVVVESDGRIRVAARAPSEVQKPGSHDRKRTMDYDDDNNNNNNNNNSNNPVSMSNSTGSGSGSEQQSDAQNKRRKLKLPGEEYKSKKGAGGDVWKKGMLEPHAYIPLDPRVLKTKNRAEAMTLFGSVTPSGKKGGKRGEAMLATKSRKKGRGVVGNRKQRRNVREHKHSSKTERK